MKHVRPVAMALAVMLFAGAAQAEVKKFMHQCDGKLCPSFQIVLTPPDGWVIDEEATRANRVQVIVPKGKDFSSAPALIYVQVYYHRDKQQSLADFAEVSNKRWLASVKDAKISERPAVERKNGKPGYLRFAFENPSKKQQAYEVGAFGIDADTDGNEFVLDVVMTGADKAALDRAEKDYIAFLKAH
ncbi:MAG TPA: hypothetical protein VHV56_08790 [Pseudolabrys sp.]|jgi:hypothetical protein|nr:hypothetical protein [Pseudolabrys sp.]